MVIESALSNRRSRRTLHVTRHAGCTSLLRPNAELLKRYKLAPMFDVIKELEVKCVRYDELHAAGKVPAPDVIKIDVQGAEYEVLEGFGGLLQTCLGVELEAHLYRIYQGQKLMHELIDLLDRFDLTLREIREQRNFDGDAVEFNAFFTRREESLRADSSIDKRKLGRIEAVWRLTTSDWGARMAAGLSD